MKCSNFIFALTMALLVLSCTKDESQDLSFDSSIVGEWEVTDIRVSGTVTMEYWGPIETNLALDAINYNNYKADISMSPNKIAPSGSFGITVYAYFWDVGETFYKELNDILVFNAGSWSTDSDLLSVNSGNETQTYRIINVKDDSMTISTAIDSEMDIYDDKSPFAIYLIFTLKKN